MGEVLKLQAQLEVSFEDFWLQYPRRVSKLDARKAWEKLVPADKAAALEALPNHIAMWAARGSPEFIPYPASWIRAERWTDELEVALKIQHCKWSGCSKAAQGRYCQIHQAAIARGETPTGR